MELNWEVAAMVMYVVMMAFTLMSMAVIHAYRYK